MRHVDTVQKLVYGLRVIIFNSEKTVCPSFEDIMLGDTGVLGLPGAVLGLPSAPVPDVSLSLFKWNQTQKSIIGKYLIWSLHPRSLSISVQLCFRVLCFDSNKIQCLSLADILMPVSHSVFSLVLYVTQKSSKLKVMSIQQTFQGVWGHLRRRLHWRNSEEVPRGELNIYVCIHT